MIQKQIVYLPVKVEDEKPKYGSKEFTIDSKNRKSVHHILEILDENKDLYDKNGFLNFGEDNSYVTHWLKLQEGYFFSPEQLNEYTANVIRQALEIAAEKATLLENGNLTYFGRYIVEEGNHYSETEIDVSKESITNTFEEIYRLFSVD